MELKSLEVRCFVTPGYFFIVTYLVIFSLWPIPHVCCNILMAYKRLIFQMPNFSMPFECFFLAWFMYHQKCDAVNVNMSNLKISLLFVDMLPSNAKLSWWHHQRETFSMLLSLCAGNSPVTGEFPTQRPVMRSFDGFFISTWINNWVNNCETGDLRCRCALYDITVMSWKVKKKSLK